MNYTLVFDYLTDAIAMIGDDIVSKLDYIPEWMNISFDVLQNKIGTLWATYANIEITDCEEYEREQLFNDFNEFIYKVVDLFIKFDYLVEDYFSSIE